MNWITCFSGSNVAILYRSKFGAFGISHRLRQKRQKLHWRWKQAGCADGDRWYSVPIVWARASTHKTGDLVCGRSQLAARHLRAARRVVRAGPVKDSLLRARLNGVYDCEKCWQRLMNAFQLPRKSVAFQFDRTLADMPLLCKTFRYFILSRFPWILQRAPRTHFTAIPSANAVDSADMRMRWWPAKRHREDSHKTQLQLDLKTPFTHPLPIPVPHSLTHS